MLIQKGIPFHPDEFGFVSSAPQLASAFHFHQTMHGDYLPARGNYTSPDLT